jgi:hypothetical protein
VSLRKGQIRLAADAELLITDCLPPHRALKI